MSACILCVSIWASLVAQRVNLQFRRPGFDAWLRKIPWRRKWQPTPVHLPGKSRGQRSLVGYSPWGRRESDTAERHHFHFHVCVLQACDIFLPSDGVAKINL